MTAKTAEHPLAALRAPFPANQISRLPKPLKKDAAKGRCNECGGWHGLPAIHLDYVGHAALTDRLLDTDIEWSWEPLALNENGLPALDYNGGLWIRLTVGGVTRLGYGAADGKTGGDAVKEIIGDALRNAAMRFGAALDLWHKGDLHADDEGEDKPDRKRKLDGPYDTEPKLETAAKAFVHSLNGMDDLESFLDWIASPDVDDFIIQLKRDLPDWWNGGPSLPQEFVPLRIQIATKKRDLEQIAELNDRTQNVLNAG